MAPNLVTLIGTFHLFVVATLAAVFDPHLKGEAPSWVYLVNAWCLFVYQTMDAVDGKQARRTGSSSPLGQLFDHGCDALGTTYIVIGLASILGFGASWQTVVTIATVQIPFFLCQWEENHIHVLRAQIGNFGVTEGQYLSMFLNIITAVLGQQMWHLTVAEAFSSAAGIDIPSLPGNLDSFQLREVLIPIAGFCPCLLSISTLVSVGKSGTNFARALVLTMPFFMQQAFQALFIFYEPAFSVFQDYSVLLLVMHGLLFSHLTNRIIVASVCHIEFPFLHKILFPIPFLTAIIIYLGRQDEPNTAYNYQLVFGLIFLYGFAIVFQYFHFVHSVTTNICKHLGIQCFTLKKTKS
eukprot:CAMPEP_0203767742 /NCGR_PEP_ID=MMETSP0099_2-20121227/1173_1 /ASSEMBLY_ACC=CAM_ASM_000209 /TAXON_ID=96639 /ORGANISM=" , Strain NY0313808BC1" /LENGTH=351 /DNA_ID=CAMNT_0050664299 /DNA_START=152 /DNA_END=1207 /DNA_ORIENTATION=+